MLSPKNSGYPEYYIQSMKLLLKEPKLNNFMDIASDSTKRSDNNYDEKWWYIGQDPQLEGSLYFYGILRKLIRNLHKFEKNNIPDFFYQQ